LQKNQKAIDVATMPPMHPKLAPIEPSLCSMTQFPQAAKKLRTASQTACKHGQTVSVAKLVMHVVKEPQQLEIPFPIALQPVAIPLPIVLQLSDTKPLKHDRPDPTLEKQPSIELPTV
jgi:hypothetical protein